MATSAANDHKSRLTIKKVIRHYEIRSPVAEDDGDVQPAQKDNMARAGMALPLRLSSENSMMEEQKKEQRNPEKTEGFQPDTQKLVHRHLSDPDHEITDEDLAKVKTGMSPGPDEPTKEALREADERIADSKKIDEDDTLPGAQKITPWDTIL